MAGIAALVLAYVLSQFYRSFLAVLATVLGRDIGVTPSELATASGIWFATFALAQFPIGYSLDVYGPRLTAATLLGIAGGGGAALFAMSTSALTIDIALGLIGIGCAPVLMAAFYLFARNYSAATFATLSSTFVGVGTLGNVAGSEPLAAAVDAFGWRATAWALCALTVATALVILVAVRDPEKPKHQPGEAPKGGFLSILKIRELWFIFPIILSGYAVAAGVRGLWAGPILRDIYGLDMLDIGRATLYMAIALSVGSILYGPLDRLLNSRKRVVVAGNLIVLGVVAYLASGQPQSVAVITTLFVMIGLFGATYAVQMTHGKAFIPVHLTGRGVTLMNFFSIGGAGLMQLLSGAVVREFNSPNDPGAGYSALFTLYAVTLGVSLMIYAFSTDARPRS
ncbi:MAG: MFS transporter [Rhizobiaceae bacterium]